MGLVIKNMKNILITGASKGIGQAIAVKLASNDTNIFIHGRDEKGLAETSKAIEKRGGRATQIISDISSPAGCDKIVQAVGNVSIDSLINNAGIPMKKSVDKLTLLEWNNIVAINLTAPFLLTQKLLPRMKQGSSIVYILSGAAKNVFPEASAYCMSKFGLRGFAEAMREELRPQGIRVINIYPSAVDTAIWDAMPGDWPRDKMMTPADVADAVTFALSCRDGVMVDDITIENMAGRLQPK